MYPKTLWVPFSEFEFDLLEEIRLFVGATCGSFSAEMPLHLAIYKRIRQRKQGHDRGIEKRIALDYQSSMSPLNLM